jgi:hypothetical protein
MTDRQMKICKIIKKNSNLATVLKKTGFDDVSDLMLVFHNKGIETDPYFIEDNNTATVTLTPELEDEYNAEKRARLTWAFNIVALISGTIASILAIAEFVIGNV